MGALDGPMVFSCRHSSVSSLELQAQAVNGTVMYVYQCTIIPIKKTL